MGHKVSVDVYVQEKGYLVKCVYDFHCTGMHPWESPERVEAIKFALESNLFAPNELVIGNLMREASDGSLLSNIYIKPCDLR